MSAAYRRRDANGGDKAAQASPGRSEPKPRRERGVSFFVVQGPGEQELECNDPWDSRILSLEDLARSGLAEPFEHLVMADGVADHDRPIVAFRG